LARYCAGARWVVGEDLLEGTPNTCAMWKAASSEGEYLSPSVVMTVWPSSPDLAVRSRPFHCAAKRNIAAYASPNQVLVLSEARCGIKRWIAGCGSGNDENTDALVEGKVSVFADDGAEMSVDLSALAESLEG